MEIKDIFENKIVETIKGLTGEEIVVNSSKSCSFDDIKVEESLCIVDGELGGDYGGHLFMLTTTKIATSIASLMFAEDGTSKDAMGDDDLDSTKELCSNVFAAAKTDIELENKSSFTLAIEKDIKYYEAFSDVENIFSSVICFDISIKSNKGQFILLFDTGANAILGGDSNNNQSNNGSNSDIILQDYIADREIQNIKRILDIKIDIKVRIGSRKMLLRDVINMDLGSVVELDRLINEHLDIVVDGKIVGHGEVVIVDGNFGIKVTSMVDQKTRLESLRIQ